MDPYEAEEFFKLSEPQRSQLLFVRLKNLEEEVYNLRLMVNMEARGTYQRELGSGVGQFMGRPTEPDMGYQRMRGRPLNSTSRRSAMPFSLATNRKEHDLQDVTNNCNGRPPANDRPLYLQKLIQVDNLCKEEMARMTAARQNLEPLNQLACDWRLEEVDDENGGELEGLSEARMVKEKDRRTDDYLAALASTSKAFSTMEMAKMSRESYGSGGRKMKDFE